MIDLWNPGHVTTDINCNKKQKAEVETKWWRFTIEANIRKILVSGMMEKGKHSLLSSSGMRRCANGTPTSARITMLLHHRGQSQLIVFTDLWAKQRSGIKVANPEYGELDRDELFGLLRAGRDTLSEHVTYYGPLRGFPYYITWHHTHPPVRHLSNSVGLSSENPHQCPVQSSNRGAGNRYPIFTYSIQMYIKLILFMGTVILQ